ncbi:MAG: hypothetical protein P4L73_04625 [Caulobacteraceae bacterium]|nr:hypothetical protein [Caulobacteraceae bacterium]
MATASGSVTFRREDEVDRNLALLGYGLLFFAVFFAGVPALVAVAIAYARKRNTECATRSHFRFQTFIFWVGFALTLLAALSALAALVILAGQIIRGMVDGRWDSLDTVVFSQVHVAAVMALFGVAGVLAVLTGAWLMVTSAYGFILLASRRSIRQTAL